MIPVLGGLILLVGLCFAIWYVATSAPDAGFKGKSGVYHNYSKRQTNDDGSVTETHVSVSASPSHDPNHTYAPEDVICMWVASPDEKNGGHWDCNWEAAGYTKTGERWVK